MGDHVEICHGEITVAVFRSLFESRCIVAGFLDEACHLLIGCTFVVLEEVDPSEALMSPHVVDLQGVDIAVCRHVKLLAVDIHTPQIVQRLHEREKRDSL